MRWVWLVWLVVVGSVTPAFAGTMTTSMTATDFGSRHIGGGVKIEKITVSNIAATGPAMTYAVTSNNTNEYLPTTGATGSLAPGASVEVFIEFAPNARGTRTATITVTTPDDASNPSDTFNVTGVGTSANMVTTWTGSPGTLDFLTAAIVGGTTTKTITISNPNPANEALKFTLVVDQGMTDYSAPASVDVVVPVNSNAQIIVTFDPTTSGTRTGRVSIDGDDAFNAQDLVQLTGVGQGAVFTAPALDFGNTVVVGTFDEKTLTVTNSGNQAGSVTAIASGNAVFTATVVGNPLPRLLNPGETVDFTIRFTPANGAAVMSNLTVTTNGTPTSLVVPVQGDGLYKAVGIVATNEPDLMIDLGQKRVNVTFAQVVTVTNLGEISQQLNLPTSDVTDCTIMPTNPTTLPASLAPLAAATFEIRVKPSSVGAGMCTVTVTTDIQSTDTIPIIWSGIASDVVVSTPPTPAINFGVVDVDAGQVIRTVVLDNPGSAPLAIGPCTISGNTHYSVITSCTNLVVAPGNGATLMVAFDPSLERSEAGTLNIGVDALSTSNVAIALSGVGADARIDLSALAISFPDTSVNTATAPTDYIDIHNPVNPDTGVAETLHISAATSDNDVFVLANEGPFDVEPGAMIRLAVTFRPMQAGRYDGTLTVLSDAAGMPMAEIALEGRGIVAGADESGGCCDTGRRRPTNAPLILVVLALLLRRRRR